jgi:uncharacterized protein (TIGR02271 family)
MYDRLEDAEGAMNDLVRLGLDSRKIGVLTSATASPVVIDRLRAKSLDVAGVGKLVANDYMLTLFGARPAGAADGVLGALAAMGVSKPDGARYLEALRNGATLEAVTIPDDRAADATAILDERSRFATATETIPIVKEDLRVGKREVDAGGVRITTHVDVRPIDKTVTLREEHVVVEHRVADRAADCSDDAFHDRSIDVTATSQRPVVTKRAHVVEEIRAVKDVGERVETIRDTLRHTEVSIDDKTASLGSAEYMKHFEQQRKAGETFESYAPAYDFGARAASEAGASTWDEAEPVLKSKWEATKPGTWAQWRNAIKFSWHRKRGLPASTT